jgi:hypothetical protein
MIPPILEVTPLTAQAIVGNVPAEGGPALPPYPPAICVPLRKVCARLRDALAVSALRLCGAITLGNLQLRHGGAAGSKLELVAGKGGAARPGGAAGQKNSGYEFDGASLGRCLFTACGSRSCKNISLTNDRAREGGDD